MPLTLEHITVETVTPGPITGFDGRRLAVDTKQLGDELRAQDARIASLDIALVHPGDSTRIVCVKDVVQPRIGRDGQTVRTIENVAVVTCGPIVGFQEGIIDMSGPGAAHTPFSELHLVVLEIAVVDGLDPHRHEEVLRTAGLAVARILADSVTDAVPARRLEFPWTDAPVPAGLPRIAYVYPVLCQGLLHDTYVGERNAAESLPATVDPHLVFDTGIVSGNCVSACDKNTTFHHQNNPVIELLLDGHGRRWDFAGIVLTGLPTRLAAKQASADAAVERVRELGADGAIVSKEGFGNPDADQMMLVRGLERAGVRTVAITDEFAGGDGASQSLADTADEADAIVSTGNANAPLRLPALDRTIGPLPDLARLAGGYPHSLHEDGSIEVELQAIVGATNELGFGRLRCRTV